MNSWLIALLGLLLAEYLFDLVVDSLNARRFGPEPPEELQSVLDPAAYAKARAYHLAGHHFLTVRRTVTLAATLAFILLGGFNAVDLVARSAGFGPVGTGLIFVGILALLRLALSLPFSIYDTFVLEQRFGFNRTTPGTFAADLAKGLLVGALLGGLAFAAVVAFFERLGPSGWIWAWAAITTFQLLLVYAAPALILPMFNRFEPLQRPELVEAVNAYARAQSFSLSGIYVMDSSKRSTKTNAFFTGLGSLRRLVLFDTLIEKHDTREIVAVVAHEVGHFKRGHIPRSMATAIALSLALFFVLSRFLNNPGVFAAFRMEYLSVHASLVFAGFFYGPVARLLSIFPNSLSRRFEYEADEYSYRTYGDAEALASALKKLTRDNLSHPSPHPAKVLVDYTHPPVLERVRRLRQLTTRSAAGP